MNIAGSAKLATWIEDTYKAYLRHLADNGEPVEYEGERSGDWDEGDSLRVSKVAKDCPKRSAAEKKGLIDRPEFTDQQLAKFEDAVRAAQVVYESIQWGCLSNPTLNMESEFRVEPGQHWTHLVGTTDAVLYHAIPGDGHRGFQQETYPIEVKRTDADRWWGSPNGITVDQFIQVVGEMILQGSEAYDDCQYGFLFCRYSSDSDPLVKVWTIRYDADWEGWFLMYGIDSQETTRNGDWPTLPDGRIFMSINDYERLVSMHRKFKDAEDPTILEAPYEFLSNWRCGKKVKAQYYAASGKHAGAKKDGTGVFKPSCPLCMKCYGSQIEKAGLALDLPEYPLEKFGLE